jgi:hypothetical protein
MPEHNVQIPSESDRAELLELVEQAKKLATRYQQLTGKPLGITGEIAEYEAAAILGLDLHAARTAGYDATEIRCGAAAWFFLTRSLVRSKKECELPSLTSLLGRRDQARNV